MTIPKRRMTLIRSLTRKKTRERQSLFLVEGVRLAREAVSSDVEIPEAYYTSGILRQTGGAELVRDLERRAQRVQRLSVRELQSLSNTETTQGVLAVVRKKPVSPASILRRDNAPHLVVACDAISDPGNLGSIIRTCDWFAVDGVLLGTSSVDLTNPKVVRGTMGGIFRLPVAEGVDLPSVMEEATRLGYALYLAGPEGGTDVWTVSYAQKTMVVLGNEARGFSERISSLGGMRVSIPRYGRAESLNVGIACGILLWTVQRTRKEARA